MTSDRNFAFGEDEHRNASVLIDLAIQEDLGIEGDLTSLSTIPARRTSSAAIVAREDLRVAGIPILELLVSRFGLEGGFRAVANDGDRRRQGDLVARFDGPTRAILGLERIALNFLQRLSGITTLTAKFVEAVADLEVEILDTRKTTPGFRALEKYAVRQGGGKNHRMGLHDAILIKDNHLAALAETGDPIGEAVRLARSRPKTPYLVEIEVDTTDQLERALECSPDIILLDNFTVENMRLAVMLRNKLAPDVLLEVSGGVRLETVRSFAETGIDRISVGALTHSARAVDLAMDFLEPDGC